MKKVVVVIPIHKANPTQNEIASFVQCYKVLGGHPIRIVAPEGLDVTVYKKAVPDCDFFFIDAHWLSSIKQYNKLKISLYFYNLFKDYEYLLTYELDAWVFRDELLYWCDKGYDYIGAPWFEGYDEPNSREFLGVGNSGFSLRKTRKCIRILKRIKRLRKLRWIMHRTKLQSIYRFEKIIQFPWLGFHIKSQKTMFNLLFPSYFPVHEDYFWSEYVYNLFRDFDIPSPERAIKFSMEGNPRYLFNLNNEKLPFGCHAWDRYDPLFWKPFIL